MVLHVTVSPECEVKLRAKAELAGFDVETFAARMLERIAGPSLDEVLAPLREEIAASGMTEEELVELLETAKHEMRSQRRTRDEP